MALETIHGGILEFLIATMSGRFLNVLMADGTVLRKELFLSQGLYAWNSNQVILRLHS
jgi:hypothetical protein